MLYEVKQEGGYGVRLRGVRELSFDVATKRLDVLLPFGKFGVKGVVSITAADDSAPWGDCIEFFGGDGSSGAAAMLDFSPEVAIAPTEKRIEDVDGYEFPREAPVPAELATTTFAPLADILDNAPRKVRRRRRRWHKNDVDFVIQTPGMKISSGSVEVSE